MVSGHSSCIAMCSRRLKGQSVNARNSGSHNALRPRPSVPEFQASSSPVGTRGRMRLLFTLYLTPAIAPAADALTLIPTDLGTRRSTTGYVFILCGGAVAWQSKRQKSVAASTVEAEYMALASAVKEVLWQRPFLNGVGYQLSEPTTLWCDSQGAISLAGNPAHHERTKHIAVRFHLTRHHVAQGDVNLQHVGTLQQAADCLTKGLDWVKHMVGVRLMGMVE
jgi:hypothetical protein